MAVESRKVKTTSTRQGLKQMFADGEFRNTLLLIFLGNLLGWVLKLLYVARTTGELPLGPWGWWDFIAQVPFAAAVALIIAAKWWPTWRELEKSYRAVLAIVAGLTTNFSIELLLGGSYLAARVI